MRRRSEIPPYTVPRQDRDLLDCGVVLTQDVLVTIWSMNFAADKIRKEERRRRRAPRVRVQAKGRGR